MNPSGMLPITQVDPWAPFMEDGFLHSNISNKKYSPVFVGPITTEKDFSAATYVFFKIGWVFLLISIIIIGASPFLVSYPWIGFILGTTVFISAAGFRLCLKHAANRDY